MNYIKLSCAILSILLFSTMINAQVFTLESSDVGGQMTDEQVFNSFGCTGENISPQLEWSHIPEGTKSFAITMYDPDAPTGSGWWHWLVFNIPVNVSEFQKGVGNLDQNLAPKEVIQSITDFGSFGYGGPCPPKGHGDHRYIITIYALKVELLDLDDKTIPAVVGYHINTNTIQKASIISYYRR